jgi:hypothetical protein
VSPNSLRVLRFELVDFDVGHRAHGATEEAESDDAALANDAPSWGDELGAGLEASIWHEDRMLRSVRRQAQGHRQHRRSTGHREDFLAL